MFRALIAALLFANLGFFAWTQGWLDSFVGVRSIGDREPERLQRQVRPESIRILPASAASAAAAAAATAAPTALACLEAGPFTDLNVAAAQSVAQAGLPAGSWSVLKTEQPGSWIIYMGRYATREALVRKEEELKRRKAPFVELTEPPALAPGLSLGRFDQRAAAATAFDQLTAQGIQTARVVELAPASSRHMLRVDKADPALAAQVTRLKAEALGSGFAACAKPSAT